MVGTKKFNEKEQFFSSDLERATGTLNTQWEEFSVFGEDVWMPTDKLTFSFGARLDKFFWHDFSGGQLTDTTSFENVEAHLSPRLAVSYQINPTTTIKASYQNGFRTPDTYYQNSFIAVNAIAKDLGYKTMDVLTYETTDAFEINITKEFEHLTIDVNAFYNIHKNQLAWANIADIDFWTTNEVKKIGKNSGLFINQEDDIEALGGEFILKYYLGDYFVISGNYSYVILNKSITQNQPAHMLKLSTNANLLKDKLHLHLNYTFNSSMEDLYTTTEWHEDYQQSKHLVNAAASYDISEKINIYFKAYNLFQDDFPLVYKSNIPYSAYFGTQQTRIYMGIKLQF